MALILGIDAAWTKAGSTGIALLETRNGRRTVLTANSSYADFLQDDASDRQLAGMPPDAALLLRKAENIAGATVDLVAIASQVGIRRLVDCNKNNSRNNDTVRV